MPLIDVTRPEVIKFLVESYEKEKIKRMKWISLHEENILKAATFHREPTNNTIDDINKATMKAGLATTTRDHIVAGRHRMQVRKDPQIVIKAKDEQTPILPVMKPVKKELKDLLREGRKEYLKVRNKIDPDNKYNFMETSNWRYGWLASESEIKLRGPAFGTVCHTLHEMRSRVGPQPDPDYYMSPDQIIDLCRN